MFVNIINNDWNLEKAEFLAAILGLNIYKLLENCGDILIDEGNFHQGLILYKQARVHILKRVLKLSLVADCQGLLKFINLCLNSSKVDISIATKIHIGNLAVMAYMELVLRYNGEQRLRTIKEFM